MAVIRKNIDVDGNVVVSLPQTNDRGYVEFNDETKSVTVVYRKDITEELAWKAARVVVRHVK